MLVGIGIAILLKAALNATGFDIPASGTVILPRTFIVSIVVGTLITVIAAIVPARRAARVAPIEALREAQDRPGRSLRFRLIAGAIVLALGVIPLLYGLFGSPANALQLVGLGVAFTFIGVAMLTPFIARPVAATLGAPIRRTGVPGKLGEENSKRNPRRTAATASALMIGLGLVVFVAVFGASAKASTTAILDRTLRADFILTSPTFAGFSTSAADDMRAVAGVETVSQVRQAEVHINDGTTFVTGLDPATFDAVSEAGVLEGSIADLSRPGTIAVHEEPAVDNGWALGDTITVEWPATGEVDLEVAAIYEENGLIGDYATSLETYDVNVAQQLDLFVLVKAQDGADIAAVRSDLEDALTLYPNAEVQNQAEFREMYATFLNQVLNLVTALLVFAVIIALFGVMNTLYLSIYERTRELGLLRAVGLTRRQTRSMVRWEAVIIAVMGALFGVVIGVAFGWALQQALASEGFTELGDPRRATRDLRGVRGGDGRGLRDRPGSPRREAQRPGGHRVRVAVRPLRGGRLSWPLHAEGRASRRSHHRAPRGGAGRLRAAARGDRGARGGRARRSVVRPADRRRGRAGARERTRRPARAPALERSRARPGRLRPVARGRDTRSARRSRTGSTTTSSSRARSPRPTFRRSRTGCARSLAEDQPFVREELARADALERFADQPYKREIVETLEEGEVGGRGHRHRVPQRGTGPTYASVRTCPPRAAWARSG